MSRIAVLTALGLALSAGPLHAQTGTIPAAVEELLIRVDITDVGAEMATELGVGADALPRSVEVPVDVAAAVCDVTQEQLEQMRAVEEHLECKAATVTPELAEATGAQLER
jgi:hypothetical protein